LYDHERTNVFDVFLYKAVILWIPACLAYAMANPGMGGLFNDILTFLK